MDGQGPDNIIKRTVLKNAVTRVQLLVRTGCCRGALLLLSGPFPIDLLPAWAASAKKDPVVFPSPAYRPLWPIRLCCASDCCCVCPTIPSITFSGHWLAGGGVCLHSTYSGLDLIIPLLSCRSVVGRWMGSVTFLPGHHPVGNAAHQLAYLELFYW